MCHPLFSRKKGLQGVSARQRKGPLRGGASRPARPRPLEAGALTFVIFRVKVYHLLGASLRARMRCQWPGKGARPTTPPTHFTSRIPILRPYTRLATACSRVEAAHIHHEAAQGSAGPSRATGVFLNILTAVGRGGVTSRAELGVRSAHR